MNQTVLTMWHECMRIWNGISLLRTRYSATIGSDSQSVGAAEQREITLLGVLARGVVDRSASATPKCGAEPRNIYTKGLSPPCSQLRGLLHSRSLRRARAQAGRRTSREGPSGGAGGSAGHSRFHSSGQCLASPLGVLLTRFRVCTRRNAYAGRHTEVSGKPRLPLLGQVDYLQHAGEKPIAITWKLHRAMPADVFAAAAAVAQ